MDRRLSMWAVTDVSSAALANIKESSQVGSSLHVKNGGLNHLTTLDKLPDKIVLKIFTYLPHREVSRLARVCKKWRMISCDSKLWTHVSLRPDVSGLHVTSMESLLALISIRFVIFMEGFMRKIYNFINGLEVLHLVGTYEKAVEEEEEEIYEVVNIHKLKSAVPNLRVVNLFGINFVDDSHVDSLSNLQSDHMMSVEWEKTSIQELDITATELSTECLIDVLCRIPSIRYLSAGQQDCFTDLVLNEFMEKGYTKSLISLDLDRNENVSEEVLLKFLKIQAPLLRGLQLSGLPHLTESFWTTVLPWLKNIRVLVMGMPEGCCQKIHQKIHIDSLIDSIANNCGQVERIEGRWDSETLRFSDRSSKAVDAIRMKCLRLRCLCLSDGKYFEMVKSNFERADRATVVRSTTNCRVTLVYLLYNYRDLIFN
ncbi:unnamed protein product [Medioppia subpectinata]|uniref:F-box domain-containing protein n=1 Tax=Medioppia subpectinata TaxID=1979941 RepID=A0A7R9KHA0_9ACAR|nr:unnamed protein product [Medioppia subpectinata]CAG2102601.1 unnamed protein product [Medioppia subpectinata]